MSADNIVAGIVLALIVAAFVLDAVLPERPRVRKPEWSSQIVGEDLPPMPVAHVEDVPALAWDVETGEVYDELPAAPERVGMNDIPRRQIGSGR